MRSPCARPRRRIERSPKTPPSDGSHQVSALAYLDARGLPHRSPHRHACFSDPAAAATNDDHAAFCVHQCDDQGRTSCRAAASSAISARSKICRFRSRARRISSPPPTTAPRKCSTRSAEGAPGLRLHRRRRRQARGQPTNPTHGSSIRSTAPRIFCTAFRNLRFRSGLQREGVLIAGLIYNPANKELYIAERGKGAFLNDQRLRVAGGRSRTIASSPAACRISDAATTNCRAAR